MATQVKHRRGTAAEIAAGTPAIGELWFNTTDNTIHMGDGVTQGGHKHVNVEYLKNSTVLVFDTVNDLKASNLATEGIKVKTKGFTTINDGGGASYVITSTGSPNESKDHTLDNGLIAELITTGYIDVRQIGCVAGGADNSSILNDNSTESLEFADGEYHIDSNTSLTGDVKISTGIISVNASATLTLNEQKLSIDSGRQVFRGTGLILGLKNIEFDWFAGDAKLAGTDIKPDMDRVFSSLESGSVIQLGQGDYIHQGSASSTSKSFSIKGRGKDKTKILFSGTETGFVYFVGGIFPSLSDMSFQLQNGTQIPTGGIVITSECLGTQVSDIFTSNIYQFLFYNGAGNGSKILNITCFDTINRCVHVQGLADCYMSNFTFSATSSWFDITPIASSFIAGEEVIGSTSGAKGQLNIVITPDSRVKVVEYDIEFSSGEVITGQTSGATATADTITRPHQLGGIRMTNQVEAFICQSGDIVGGRFAMTMDASSNTVYNRPAYNHFTDVYFDSAKNGVTITKAVALRFTGCWFSNRPSSGVVLESSVEDISFSNCSFINNWGHGAEIRLGSSGIRFNGCTFSGNSAGGPGYNGVWVDPGASDFVIQGCKAGGVAGFGTQSYGIYINSGASDRYIVKDNLVLGNSVGGVSDGGTGTNKSVNDNF